MSISRQRAHQELIDVTRMQDAAIVAGRSAEALFGYLSRLDALRDAGDDLGQEALAERAADAELHTRIVLNAGLDALNELHDLGIIDDALRKTIDDPAEFNEVKLTEAVEVIAMTFREHLPTHRWDWLADAGRLVADVDVRVERDDAGLRGTITHSGQSTVVRLGSGAPATRVSTRAFFSAGPKRVYVPSSAGLASTDEMSTPVAPYDAALGGMAFAREWVYRHARNAAELGPPARTGGGPVAVVIVIILVVAVALAAIAAAILGFACIAGSDWSSRWAVYLGIVGSFLGGSAEVIDKNSGQTPILTVGTNHQ